MGKERNIVFTTVAVVVLVAMLAMTVVFLVSYEKGRVEPLPVQATVESPEPEPAKPRVPAAPVFVSNSTNGN